MGPRGGVVRGTVRSWLALCLGAWPLAGAAQGPDVTIQVDLRLTLQSERGGVNRVRLYDRMGRPSLVTARLNAESGLVAVVSQRLERVARTDDRDNLEEAFVERPGAWRLGKQVLPFGSSTVLRESAWAARLNTELVFEALPVQLAVCDGGKNGVRGFSFRLGRRLGLSLAAGNHFGIASSSLPQVRRPESAPGRGRGFREAFGADYHQVIADDVRVRLEYVALRRGETASDSPEDVTEVLVSVLGGPGRPELTTAWSRAWRERLDFYRLEILVPLDRHVALEGLLRFRKGEWSDSGITLRVRI